MRTINLTEPEVSELENMVDVATMGLTLSMSIGNMLCKKLALEDPARAKMLKDIAVDTERAGAISEIGRKLREATPTDDAQGGMPTARPATAPPEDLPDLIAPA